MRIVGVVVSSTLIAASVALAADPQAKFLGGSIYAAAADCRKVVSHAAGSPRTAEPIPQMLTAEGYSNFEGMCRFVNIDERYPNRLWTVTLSCESGGESRHRVEVWRKQAEGRLTVTSGTTVSELVACPTSKSGAAKKE